MKTLLITLTLACGLGLLLGCNSDPPAKGPDNPPSQDPPDLSATPMPNEEAEIAAMVLSRELIAPRWLYDRIERDLKTIRAQYADSSPAFQLTFYVPLLPSAIGLKVDSAVFFDSVSGGKKRFDSLNQVYRMKSVTNDFGQWYSVYFEGRLNPARLVDIYAGIPGELMAFPQGIGPGDWPFMVIYPEGETFKYFFRLAWGDCPSGCIFSKIYYVSTTRRAVEYHGYYLADCPPHPEPPKWLDTFRMARDTALYYNRWSAESTESAESAGAIQLRDESRGNGFALKRGARSLFPPSAGQISNPAK